MNQRLLTFALGALVLQGSCSENRTQFYDSARRADDAGEAGAPSGGTAGATEPKGGDTSTSGSDSGGSMTGGDTSTGGSSTGGEATGGANEGGTQTGGTSGSTTGGEAGDGGAGNTGGTTGPMSGAGGMAGAGGIAGASGAAGSGAGAAGAGGAAGSGGTAGAGAAGSGGMAGRAGAPGRVEFRADSFRMTTTQVPVTRAPAIRGQDGLLLAHIIYDSTSSTSDAEDFGFEPVTTATRTIGEIIVLNVFWKSAAGPAGQPTTEPTSYGIGNSQDRYQNLMLFAVHGHDPMLPIAASAIASGGGTQMSVSSVEVTRAGSLGLWWKAGYNASTVANPAGWTMIVQDQDEVNDAAWRAFDVGSTGAVTSAQLLSDPWANVLVVVQPP